MINRPAIHLTSPRGCADKPSHLFLETVQANELMANYLKNKVGTNLGT